jgi:hypothetical protein
MTQDFKTVGKISINPVTQPLVWHDVLVCTICGALVLGEYNVKAPQGLVHAADATTVTHAKWHQELEQKIKDARAWTFG